MKLLSPLRCLLLWGSASAMILEREFKRGSDGNFWVMKPCPSGNGECAYYAKVGGGNSGGHGGRQLESTDPAFEAPVATSDPNDLTIDSAGTIDIAISGWDVGAGASLEFVLAKEDSNYEVRFPVIEGEGGPFLVVNGEAKAMFRPSEGDGVYHVYLDYTTADGEEKVVDGGSFWYKHVPTIVRRSGPVSVVEEGPYEDGGKVQNAVGRIYFESLGVTYGCTGTVIRDSKTGRSLIFTAAHCVWEDQDENFGSDVIFVPNRDAVTGDTVLEGNMTLADIHRQCADDICGCWRLSGGVVLDKWRDTPWPERLEFDYGFYVVDDEGRHEGTFCGSEALDNAVEPMELAVGVPVEGEFVHAFGYSLEFNPDFRYCADTAVVEQPTPGLDTAWLDACLLSGGASGGPWMTGFDPETGVGKVVSVNSWSDMYFPGNGGPFIPESAARCLVNAARDADMEAMMAEAVGEQGIFVDCFERPCITQEEADEMDSTRKLSSSSLRGMQRQLCEGVTIPSEELAKP